MGRSPCCDKANVKKGPWSPEEDAKLKEFIEKHGTGGNWIALPHKAGLKRCGKSCRLRWLNYLRPDIKHGDFSEEEDRIICSLFATIGSRWSIIASQLPGRTDNDIKNYWNTKLKKKLLGITNAPSQRKPVHQQKHFFPSPISPPLQATNHATTPTQLPTSSQVLPMIPGDNYMLNNTSLSTTSAPSCSLLQLSYYEQYQLKDTTENTMSFGSSSSAIEENKLMFPGGVEYNYEEIKQLLISNYSGSINDISLS
ncbi:hypothetical protein Cni_G16142 [Canna indica]|uniref:Uncharacterized protein n=1 Tax=Canna indica TaxID=4628 RepID=A0AAQ3QCB6_9LILI|nr:hypothetical protein Cni_G16142 [Canna indica]